MHNTIILIIILKSFNFNHALNPSQLILIQVPFDVTERRIREYQKVEQGLKNDADGAVGGDGDGDDSGDDNERDIASQRRNMEANSGL